MRSRGARLIECAVELGHRQIKGGGESFNLLRLRLRLAGFDAAQPCHLDVREARKVGLVDAAQLPPVTYALSWSQAHTRILHTMQALVNIACTVGN